jgi:WD40 repeat protein/serine/threonine protein kinase
LRFPSISVPLFDRDERVATSKRRHTKPKKYRTDPPPQGSRGDTRTFPFPGIDNAGDVRLAALKIRRFEILDEIGRGGHGVVFRANDRILRRPVALKLPRPEVLRSKEMRRRFVGEAQVVAALDHPNIIKVYDAGFEAAVCYIAQELCDGPSLATWLKEHPHEITAEVAAAVMLALARGLEHAHRQGVLHRDLKPANVLLKPRPGTTPQDASPGSDDPATSGISKLFPFTPKLGDFGICKAFDLSPDTTATRTGMVLGTAAYMPPEQAVGTASELGPQSDVYSLGAILYEILTGRPPFEGVSSAEVLKQVLVDRPVSIRATRRDVPAALDAICLKCLEKSPAQRYATAAELADDLRRFLTGEPVRAPRKNAVNSLLKSLRRPRRSIQVAVALAGWILVLVSLGFYLQAPRTSPDAVAGSTGDNEAALSADVRSAFNLWHENAERLRDNPNVRDEMAALLSHHVPKSGEVDRRGFDWHYAWRLCHPAEAVGTLTQVASFQAHVGDVYFVAFCRDGSRFATAGKDHTARIWDAKTRKQLCVCSGHTHDVNCVDFSPDQRWLATASEDRTVKLWDAATGKALFTLTGHETEIVAVRFNPTGDTLVSGDDHGVLKLWDLSSKQLLKSEDAHHGHRIQTLAYGMGGHLLASIGTDNVIRLWEMPGMVFRTEHQTAQGQCAAFSPVANLIACAGLGTIQIDDVHTGGHYATFSDHVAGIESIAFSPDGRQLASCDGHGALRLWDLGTRQGWNAAPVRYRKTERNVWGEPIGVGFWCVAYSPDGTQLITSSRDGVVDIWDTSITPHWTMLAKSVPGQWPVPLAYSPDGRRLAVARRFNKSSDDRFQVWDVSQRRPKLVRDLAEVSAASACFSRDGKQLAVGTPGKVAVYDPKTCDPLFEIGLAAASTADAVAYDGRGSLVVLENSNKQSTIGIFDSTTGKTLRTLMDSQFAAGVGGNGVSLSADGKVLALIAPNSGRVVLCDVTTGQLLPGPLGRADALQFAPVGNLLGVASSGGVETWDVQAQKQQGFLAGLARGVGPLSFSADGRLLITVSHEQKSIQLWDVRRHNLVFALPLPAEAAAHAFEWHLAVSPDGKQIAASMCDKDRNGGLYLYSSLPSDVTVNDAPSLALDVSGPN